MKLSKMEFVENLTDLLTLRDFEPYEIPKRTSIGRAKLRAILDPEQDSLPDIKQALELCELLGTSMYYLCEKRGPRDSIPKVTDSMIDIMDALLDIDRPDIALIVKLVTKLEDHETLLTIRKMAHAVVEARSIFAEDYETIEAALKHAP